MTKVALSMASLKRGKVRSTVAGRVLLDQSMEAGEKSEGGYESGKDGLNMVVVIPSWQWDAGSSTCQPQRDARP